MKIDKFDGEWSWLSNFYPAVVTLNRAMYPSVENAYQAAKTRGVRRIPFETCTPGQAKRMGSKLALPLRWDEQKVIFMKSLLSQKFSPGSALAQQLVATGAAHIEEGNTWGDTFWGVCNGVGHNLLGHLLMTQRQYLIDKLMKGDE